jgi:hypothetical protein
MTHNQECDFFNRMSIQFPFQKKNFKEMINYKICVIESMLSWHIELILANSEAQQQFKKKIKPPLK